MAHPETVSPGRLRLVPLTADLVPAVDAFHERLRLRGGPHYRLGTAIAPTASSESPSKSVWLETLFAFDGHDVRGGIMLQHRTLHSATGTKDVVNIQLPLSEGTIDRKFAHVGMWLIRTVLQSHPYAYAVGMGALDQPLPKLLSAMRWTVVPVPFFFHVNRPTRFVRKMPALNRTRGRRLLTTIAGLSGAAWLGVTLAQGVTAFRARRDRPVGRSTVHVISEWGDWSADSWLRSQADYALAATRDTASLRELYPTSDSRFRSWEVRVDGRQIGWVTVVVSEMRDSAYFGDLTVGTVVDCQAVPGSMNDVASAARRLVADIGVDITLTNQLHRDWQFAFRRAGFLNAASNFMFAASPAFMKAGGVTDISEALRRTHVTRGDGDGMINL